MCVSCVCKKERQRSWHTKVWDNQCLCHPCCLRVCECACECVCVCGRIQLWSCSRSIRVRGVTRLQEVTYNPLFLQNQYPHPTPPPSLLVSLHPSNRHSFKALSLHQNQSGETMAVMISASRILQKDICVFVCVCVHATVPKNESKDLYL